MSSTPLPKQVDVRRLIAADTEICAREPLRRFARLAPMLVQGDESATADVDVNLHFHLDDGGSKCIDGEVQATVEVLCQRCMQPMPLRIDSTFAVAVVWSDDEASRLPKHLEPYIVGDGPQDIRDLIEDELILCVPYASYHDDENCAENYRQSPNGDVKEVQDERKPNPFKVLEQLMPGANKNDDKAQ